NTITITGSSAMRNRVSAVGIVIFIVSVVGSSMEGRVDAFGQFPADALYLHEFLDAGPRQSAQAAEVAQQGRPAACADARDFLKGTRLARLLATAAMAGDRETVRLVADRLHQVRGR